MIAGLLLSETTEKESILAFLDDDTEVYRFKTNTEIAEKIEQENPDIVAVNVGSEVPEEELHEEEEELKEEGYSFTPSRTEPKKIKRLQALKAEVNHLMPQNAPEFIRFDPFITSEELALDGDASLESLGVATDNINSSREFDAVLGAVTARFYQQDQFNDLGVIVPDSLQDKEE